jgi:hypothetical protein
MLQCSRRDLQEADPRSFRNPDGLLSAVLRSSLSAPNYRQKTRGAAVLFRFRVAQQRGLHGQDQDFEGGSDVIFAEKLKASIADKRSRASHPRCARRIEAIQKELRGIYSLANGC